jgi:hypothetical protein
MGNVRHGLYRHLLPSAACSNAMRLIYPLWVTPDALGFFQFGLGGLFWLHFYLGDDPHKRGIVQHLLCCWPMLFAARSNAMSLIISS